MCRKLSHRMYMNLKLNSINAINARFSVATIEVLLKSKIRLFLHFTIFYYLLCVLLYLLSALFLQLEAISKVGVIKAVEFQTIYSDSQGICGHKSLWKSSLDFFKFHFVLIIFIVAVNY